MSETMKGMLHYELDAEETALLSDFEAGKLKPAAKQEEEIRKIKTCLQAKHNKVKRVNIRMTEQDFLAAQSLSLEEGLPYQTLLSSILHKYFTGRLFQAQHA